ncbi:hypothetical protein HI914_03224 [Erysiphe necator]|nr:hypothetical protein HI914_03224 [Erysiphe necator]
MDIFEGKCVKLLPQIPVQREIKIRWVSQLFHPFFTRLLISNSSGLASLSTTSASFFSRLIILIHSGAISFAINFMHKSPSSLPIFKESFSLPRTVDKVNETRFCPKEFEVLSMARTAETSSNFASDLFLLISVSEGGNGI